LLLWGLKEQRKLYFKKEIANSDDSQKKWLEKEAEYAELFANPYRAAERGIVDEVIFPNETRSRVISGFKMLENKNESLPPKKHGNIPL
jgi:propionyl-CoA carboxylase beta chain